MLLAYCQKETQNGELPVFQYVANSTLDTEGVRIEGGEHAEDTKGVLAHESLSQLIKRINWTSSKDVISSKVQYFAINGIMHHRFFGWFMVVNLKIFNANCKLRIQIK